MKMGENVEIELKGDMMTIKVDLSKRFGNSKSGKTVKIASTGGNQNVGHSSGAVIGLNVYTKTA